MIFLKYLVMLFSLRPFVHPKKEIWFRLTILLVKWHVWQRSSTLVQIIPMKVIDWRTTPWLQALLINLDYIPLSNSSHQGFNGGQSSWSLILWSEKPSLKRFAQIFETFIKTYTMKMFPSWKVPLRIFFVETSTKE